MIMKVIEKLGFPLAGRRGKKGPLAIKPDYFSQQDIRLFKEGSHFHLYRKLGAHVMTVNGVTGAYFSVWAPGAKCISTIGDFNGWNRREHILNLRQDNSGIWEGFIPGVAQGDLYKFHIISKHKGREAQKADPFAFWSETAPRTASIVSNFRYQWNDQVWMDDRAKSDFSKQPMSVYEVHLGSWRRNADQGFKTYRQLADELVAYVADMGFTHVEIMPLMEHPFYGSWGYQALSYFAPTARYGPPEDLMYLIDRFHQNGIGVILDWVVSHFPYDEHGLANFDGTKLFEYDELHPDWQSCVFNVGKYQAIEFLISSAFYWLEQYHIDGLRVDAVASMLYLDYSRRDGDWKPNIFGGRENLESISFIRRLNEEVKNAYPDVQMIAEDSTAWPNVSRPCAVGGLNFDMKWNMGWMHDTLKYFQRDFKARGKFHEEIAFCLHYAFSENFVLALSHDEVVYEKSSLLGKMPGKDWEKFSNLRVLFGYMFSHPGKKLLFMGGEFAQWAEWDHDGQLHWDLLQHARHQQMQQWVKDLNALYKNETALHEQDFSSEGFEWLDMGHNKQSIFAFLRKGLTAKDDILIICNFRNRTRHEYTVGIPYTGVWSEILNSDDKKYGGKGIGNTKNISAIHKPWKSEGFGYTDNASHHIKDYSLTLDLPPISVVFLKRQ